MSKLTHSYPSMTWPSENLPNAILPLVFTGLPKDIYGESKQAIRQRYPQATFIEIEQAGDLAWSHNPALCNPILNDCYGNL
jgi:hypothetical protein